MINICVLCESYVTFRGRGPLKDILIPSYLNVFQISLCHVSIYMILFINIVIICDMVYRNNVLKMNLPCEHQGCTGWMLKYWSMRYMMDCDFNEVSQWLYCHVKTMGLRPKEGKYLVNILFIRDKHTTQIIEDMMMEIFKILDKEAEMIGTLDYLEELKKLFKEWGSLMTLQQEIWGNINYFSYVVVQ